MGNHRGVDDALRAELAGALADTDVDHLIDVGMELADAGAHAEAERVFRRAVELGAEWATFNVGNELVEQGRDEAAVVMYERAVRARESAAWLNLGQALERLGDLAGALRAYTAGHLAGDLNAGLSRAFLLREIDEPAAAEAVAIDVAMAGSPQADAVAAAWVWWRSHDPSLEDRLRAGADRYPDARSALAALLRESGRVDEAVTVLQRGVVAGERESYLPLANVYADELDDPVTAEATYRAGIAAGDHWCHHNLGLLLAELGRREEAVAEFRLGAAAGDPLAVAALKEMGPEG